MNESVDAEMAKVAPGQRAMLRTIMKQRATAVPNGKLIVRKAAKSDHVGRYSCQVWEGTRGSNLVAHYCVVPCSASPGGDEIAAVTHKMIRLSREIDSGLSATAGSRGSAFFGASMIETQITEQVIGCDQFNGFPVLRRYNSTALHVSPGLKHKNVMST